MSSSKIDGIGLRRDVEPEDAIYTPHTRVWTPDRRDYVLPSPIVVDDDGYVDLDEAPGFGKRSTGRR